MWSVYAVFAMLCFVGMQLLFTELTRLGFSSPTILVFVFGVAGLLCLAHVGVVRPEMPFGARALGALVVAGVLSYAGNVSMVRAMSMAQNPGYAIAIVGLQALGVTLAAVALFGAELTLMKGVGVALSAIGVALLVL